MVEASGLTDTGCVRANNEDYFLLEPNLGLYIVADGIGGAQAGEHASRLAAETVRDVMLSEAPQTNGTGVGIRALCDAFEEANRRVIELAQTDRSMEGLGTTLIAAADNGREINIASVGDSRAYCYSTDGELTVLTQDQTWINEIGRRLGIPEESLKTHQMRHVLTMAIGVGETLRVNTHTIPHLPGLQILLCSDGLHGVVSEPEIGSVLSSDSSLDDKCQRLIDLARDKGGPDNITAVVLRLAA